jgi:hypothetical protein
MGDGDHYNRLRPNYVHDGVGESIEDESASMSLVETRGPTRRGLDDLGDRVVEITNELVMTISFCVPARRVLEVLLRDSSEL